MMYKCECIEKLFAVTVLMVLLIGKLFVARVCFPLSFRLFCNHKQFCSRFVAFRKMFRV
jgi:hypothetical protein